MAEENNTKSTDPLQDTGSTTPSPVVVGSGTEPQFQPQATSQPVQPLSENHKLLKAWLITSLIILILNAGLLSLTLIPFAGVFIALGAAPIFLATGVLGLVNLFVVSRSVSKKYISDGFSKVATTVLVLSAIAVLGGVSSPFILAVQHKENAKTQKVQDEVNSYYSEVTVEKATELLNSCKIYRFNYSNSKGNDWEKTPETTASGILIFDEYASLGKPSSSAWANARGKYIMYIADRTADTVVPIARQAQKTCDIHFRHDNTDEQ
jgi:hypothetical protein